MATVTFKPVQGTTKTIMIGQVSEYGKQTIKYLIRTEEAGLYSVYESMDNGRTGRLSPRVSTETAHECYHESTEAAREWIQKYEDK